MLYKLFEKEPHMLTVHYKSTVLNFHIERLNYYKQNQHFAVLIADHLAMFCVILDNGELSSVGLIRDNKYSKFFAYWNSDWPYILAYTKKLAELYSLNKNNQLVLLATMPQRAVFENNCVVAVGKTEISIFNIQDKKKLIFHLESEYIISLSNSYFLIRFTGLGNYALYHLEGDVLIKKWHNDFAVNNEILIGVFIINDRVCVLYQLIDLSQILVTYDIYTLDVLQRYQDVEKVTKESEALLKVYLSSGDIFYI